MISENREGLAYNNRNERVNRERKQPLGLMMNRENENHKQRLEHLTFHNPIDFQKPQKYKPLDQDFELWAYVNQYRLESLEKKQTKVKYDIKRGSFSPCQNLKIKYMKRRPSLVLMKQSQELSFDNAYKEVKTARNEDSLRETSRSFSIKRKRTLKKKKNTQESLNSCGEELGENTKRLIEQLTTYEIKFQTENQPRLNNRSRRAKYQ